MKGIFAATNWVACAIIPSRPSGAQTPIEMLPSAGTGCSPEWVIAPGWNAVSWLASRSVVM